MPAALNVLKAKKNMRVMDTPGLDVPRKPYRKYRSILGGLLTQDANVRMLEEIKVVTKRQPTEKEMKAHALRLEDSEIREIQRHSLRAGRAARSASGQGR